MFFERDPGYSQLNNQADAAPIFEAIELQRLPQGSWTDKMDVYVDQRTHVVLYVIGLSRAMFK